MIVGLGSESVRGRFAARVVLASSAMAVVGINGDLGGARETTRCGRWRKSRFLSTKTVCALVLPYNFCSCNNRSLEPHTVSVQQNLPPNQLTNPSVMVGRPTPPLIPSPAPNIPRPAPPSA